MRRLICIGFLFVCCSASVLAQGNRPHLLFDPLSAKLRVVKVLSNYDRGFGSPNDFYLLSKEFLEHRTVKDFKRMARDRNPIVRAMGLLCLAQTDADEYSLMLALHSEDKEEVYFWRGCIVSKITVGEFTRQLMSNPYFLEPGGKRPAAI
jgi:hypothetical protein